MVQVSQNSHPGGAGSLGNVAVGQAALWVRHELDPAELGADLQIFAGIFAKMSQIFFPKKLGFC